MVSPEVKSDIHEILVHEPDGRLEVVDLRTLCESREDALRLASALQDWFHLGVWYDAAFDHVTPDEQLDMLALRVGLKARGVDVARVAVRIVPARDHLPTELADEDDTDIEDVDVLYLPADGDGLTDAERLFGRG